MGRSRRPRSSARPGRAMFLERPPAEPYDVVVVGSGPAGLTVAGTTAVATDARVLVIESGGLEPDPAVQRLAEVDAAGDLDASYFSHHSRRLFGGTSATWTGICAVLGERSFLAGDWPIDYRELYAEYPRAAEILGLPAESHERPERPLPETEAVVYRPLYHTYPLRFGDATRELFAGSERADVLLGHTAGELVHRRGRVTAVRVGPSVGGGQGAEIRGDRFVLACGGLGNPILLEASGLAAGSPVGRGLADHPHIYGVARVRLDEERVGSLFTQHPAIHTLALSDRLCLEAAVPSCSFSIDEPEEGSGLLRGRRRSVLEARVSVRAEIPLRDGNRVRHGPASGAAGRPAARVDFRFGHREELARQWRLLTEAVVRGGLGRTGRLAEERVVEGGGHFIGSTRMGEDPARSVCDADCRVHGTGNLYLAGSSVFAAAGAANPTYTIVALALRLADHLGATG